MTSPSEVTYRSLDVELTMGDSLAIEVLYNILFLADVTQGVRKSKCCVHEKLDSIF